MAANANLIGIYVSVTLKYPPSSTVQGTVAEIVPQTSTLVLRQGKRPTVSSILVESNEFSQCSSQILATNCLPGL